MYLDKSVSAISKAQALHAQAAQTAGRIRVPPAKWILTDSTHIFVCAASYVPWQVALRRAPCGQHENSAKCCTDQICYIHLLIGLLHPLLFRVGSKDGIIN